MGYSCCALVQYKDHVDIEATDLCTRLAPIMLERLADQVASTTPTSTRGFRKVNCSKGGGVRVQSGVQVQ